MMYYRQQGGTSFFPIPGFPGSNVNQRVDRLERQVDRLNRQVDNLNRRLERVERRLGMWSGGGGGSGGGHPF